MSSMGELAVGTAEGWGVIVNLAGAPGSIGDGQGQLTTGINLVGTLTSVWLPPFSLGTNVMGLTVSFGQLMISASRGDVKPGDILAITGGVLGIIGAGAAVAGAGLPVLGWAATLGLINSLAGMDLNGNGESEIDAARRYASDWLSDKNIPNWNNQKDFRLVRRYTDPLALDLDGDGLETLAANQWAGAMFDHDGDGFRTAGGWVKGDDGMLVLDRNGNGSIDDGSELFGDNTLLADGSKAANGYAALAELDGNGDGVVDQQDARFAELKVWRDLDADGISENGELFTLQELGVASLNTAFTNTNTTLSGNNILAQQGSYTRTDGSTAQMGDINFVADNKYSEFKQPDAPLDIAKLLASWPVGNGKGRKFSLHPLRLSGRQGGKHQSRCSTG